MATQLSFTTKPVAIQWKLIPTAPADMFMALEKMIKIYIIPKNGRNPNGDVILIIQLCII
jgi:hypothetical protein